MGLEGDFKEFLKDIEPSASTKNEISSAQKAMRDYLKHDEEYQAVFEDSFLSGSYAKHTAIRPVKDEDNRDVDIDIETSYGRDSNPTDVLEKLRDTLLQSPKYSTAKVQSHSVGVSLSKLDIDVVPLVSDGTDWYVGNSDDDSWSKADPRGHLKWATGRNDAFDDKYKPVVKIVKWWRREHCPCDQRWPKGITLEKIVADCFPDCSTTYSEIVRSLFRNIVDRYEPTLLIGYVPQIKDPVIADNNLAEGYTWADFRDFLDAVQAAISILDNEGETNSSWRKILGDRFPCHSEKESSFGLSKVYLDYDEALRVDHRQKPLWDIPNNGPNIQVKAVIKYSDGNSMESTTSGVVIPKGCSVTFKMCRSSSMPNGVARWQVVNTGYEAEKAGCLRGGFESSNSAKVDRTEFTEYAGRHYVQAFVIQKGRCIGYSDPFFINIE